MGNSYYKKCNVPGCDKRIQMRKMPHGQWVPFEDYDTVHTVHTVHEHSKSPTKGRIREWVVIPPKEPSKEKSNFTKIDFPNFDLNVTGSQIEDLRNLPSVPRYINSSINGKFEKLQKDTNSIGTIDILKKITNHPILTGLILQYLRQK